MTRHLCLLILFLLPAFGQETIKPEAQDPWKESAGNFSLEYDGKNYANLSATLPVEPETHYEVRWELRSSEMQAATSVQVSGEVGSFGKFGRGYPAGPEWNGCVFYFYSGTANAVPLRWYVNPSPARRVELRGFTVKKVAAKAMTENLFPDPFCRQARHLPPHWKPGYVTPELPLKVEATPDFLTGGNGLRWDLKRLEKGTQSVQSVELPSVPGKKHRLRFWARAEAELTLTGGVNGWSMYQHRGGHWYKNTGFKLGPAWTEYTLEVDIPPESDAYPDLATRLVVVNFSNSKNSEGRAYLNGFKWCVLD